MVKGLDTFRGAFAGHADRYVLIGGVAASLALEEAGIELGSRHKSRRVAWSYYE
ncbi:MAG: hypothetical protein ACOH2P_21315 [Pseudomonas sp.]